MLKTTARKVFSLLAFVAAFLAAKLLVSAVMSGSFASNAQIRGRIERLQEENPAVALTYNSLRRNFPDRYNAMMGQIVSHSRTAKDKDEARAYGFGLMQSLVKENIHNIAAAPTSDLVRLVNANAAFAQALRTDAHSVCAHYALRGVGLADVIPQSDLMSAAQLTAASLDAARAGIDHPSARIYQKLSDGDGRAFGEEIARQGLSATAMKAFAANQLATLNESDQCDIGLAIYRVTASLLPEVAARVMGYLLTAS